MAQQGGTYPPRKGVVPFMPWAESGESQHGAQSQKTYKLHPEGADPGSSKEPTSSQAGGEHRSGRTDVGVDSAAHREPGEKQSQPSGSEETNGHNDFKVGWGDWKFTLFKRGG